MGTDFVQFVRELKVIGTHEFIPYLHVHACRFAHRMIVLINLSAFTNLFRFFFQAIPRAFKHLGDTFEHDCILLVNLMYIHF